MKSNRCPVLTGRDALRDTIRPHGPARPATAGPRIALSLTALSLISAAILIGTSNQTSIQIELIFVLTSLIEQTDPVVRQIRVRPERVRHCQVVLLETTIQLLIDRSVVVVLEYLPSRLAGQRRPVRLTGWSPVQPLVRSLVRFPNIQINRMRIGRDDLVVQNIARIALGRT